VKRYPFWVLMVLALGMVLILTTCGPASGGSISPISTPAEGGSTGKGDVVPAAAQEITNLVKQDLAEREKLSQDEITVVSVQAVEWRDASLGCPQPGHMYAQVITPGYEIVLRAQGQEYTYHAGGKNFVLCERGEPAPDKHKSADEVSDPQEVAVVQQARTDLSERFDVALDSIKLESFEAVEWRDSSLGCPAPGMNYLMVVTPGYLIKLQAGDRTYEYHADENHVVYCANPKPPLTGAPGNQPDAGARMADVAKADLAQKLDVSVEQIQLVTVEAVDWPDASLGCPEPGKMYAQMITPGYQITLLARGKEYTYHSNLGDVFLCQK
jgi:hypothetical protein